MSVHDHREPPSPLDGLSGHELLIAHRAATAQLLAEHQKLAELTARIEKPAQIEAVVMTPQQNPQESRERWEDPVLSVGLYNPTSLVVYFNPIGSATPTARAYPVGANNLLVLPIHTSGPIEVGCDPTQLGQNNAVVFLMRFFTVQPAFLGKAV